MIATPKTTVQPPVDLSKKGYSKTGNEFKAIWENLQGNILKSHGRDHAAHIFFRLSPDTVADSKAYLRQFAKLVTTAHKAEIQSAQKLLKPAEFFYGLYLAAKGYVTLGHTGAMPSDPQFRKGMKEPTVQTKLADNAATWETDFTQDFDGMLLVAQDSSTKKVKNGQTPRPQTLTDKAAEIADALHQLGAVTVVQYGDQVFNIHEEDGPKKGEKRDAIENFGYVDGISQPKFFKEDMGDPNSITQWDPSMPWDLVLVPDAGTNQPNCFGSYFVFRKLEQNVAAFTGSEEELGDTLLAEYKKNRPAPLSKAEESRIKDLAGALVVGRWEDGMPVKVSDDPGFIRADHPHGIPGIPVDSELVGKINNFNYNSDDLAAKCPFHAHIRKTNPRGESMSLGATFEQERRHTMARRGITYGIRPDDPNAEIEPSERPTKDVGLLFMSFQSDVSNQFEFIQSAWVDNKNFVKPATGLDPIIGQGGAGNSMADGNYSYQAVYNDPTTGFKPESATNKSAHPFERFVTMKGGEYFFAPSLSFLKNL